MKLTNPTDDELRHALALEVAKYTLSQYGEYFTSEGVFVGSRSTLPPWTESANAVLPWLEKLVQRRAFNDHKITITGENYYIDGPGGNLSKDPSLPRAAVIALLRAHGVEVEIA